MTDEEVTDLIAAEFRDKTLGTTAQYMEIHAPVYRDERIVIERVDRNKADLLIAYLPVADEYFSFAVYIDPNKKEIINIGTESRNVVCLRATSQTLTAVELQNFTTLKATRYWNNGDLWPNKKSTYSNIFLEFEPNAEPDEFEDKLKKLLIFLKRDKEGIFSLAANAKAYIHVIMDFHAGNQMLGSVHLDMETIGMLNELNLELSFDFAAWGNPFK